RRIVSTTHAPLRAGPIELQTPVPFLIRSRASLEYTRKYGKTPFRPDVNECAISARPPAFPAPPAFALLIKPQSIWPEDDARRWRRWTARAQAGNRWSGARLCSPRDGGARKFLSGLPDSGTQDIRTSSAIRDISGEKDR